MRQLKYHQSLSTRNRKPFATRTSDHETIKITSEEIQRAVMEEYDIANGHVRS